MIREIYGRKVGMTQIFSEEGSPLAVTLLDIEPVYLLEKVSYSRKVKVKIGCFKIDEKKVNKLKKPIRGYFEKLGVSPYKFIREVDVENNFDFPSPKADDKSKSSTGDPRQIGIEIFKEGDLVDIGARTKGRGFAGGMKRHGWSGQPCSHGSMTHRRIGSAGASSFPSKIVKGHNMPGHMGDDFRTIKNLKILKVDKDKNLLFIKGSIPGSRGAIVLIKKVN